MKIFFLISLLASASLQAQLAIRSPLLTDPSATVVYIGVDNQIEVTGMDSILQYNCSVSGGGSSLAVIAPGKLIIKATKPDTLTLIIRRKRKLVFQKYFTVQKLPEGRVTLADSLSNTSLSKETILANPKLKFIFPGCLYKSGMEIISFSMTIDIKDKVIEIPSPSNMLTEKQLLLVKEADSGALITIDNIRACNYKNKEIRLPFLMFFLK